MLNKRVIGFFTHFVVGFDNKSSFASTKSVTYIKGCDAAIMFALKVRGVTSLPNFEDYYSSTIHL